MGLRGIGAKKKSLKLKLVASNDGKDVRRKNPWEKSGLSRAEKVIAFCEDLTITSGTEAGGKLQLRGWQREFILDVYAEDDQGNRPIRTAVLSLARKNGKTQLAAALALCHLSGPESENRGEVYACANDRFQAGKIFNEMEAMISHHAWLSVRTNIGKFHKSIQDLVNGSTYNTLTSEAKTKMGLSPSFVVYDELGQSTSRELYDAMDSAMGARKNPLMLVISTQAATNVAPLSLLIDYGLNVQAGTFTDKSFHLTLYTTPETMNPWSPEAWKMANPALDDFRSLEDVERMADQAQRLPTQENAFRNLILNQRIASEARFMEPSAWKKCSGKVIIPPGMPVTAGLDLGSTRDLSSLVLARCDAESGNCHVKQYTWVPGDLLTRADQDGAPYDAWAKQGIIIPAGTAMDPSMIAEKIIEINHINPIEQLVVDRWKIEEVKRELRRHGITTLKIVEHGQGFKDMSPAVNIVEQLVTTQKLKHGGDPVLTWCANNAIVIRDPAGGRKFDKSQRDYRARIDALVAMAMALRCLMNMRPEPTDIEALIG